MQGIFKFLRKNLFASLNLADKIFRLLEERGKFFALNFFVDLRGLDGFYFFVEGGNNRVDVLRHERADVIRKLAPDIFSRVVETGRSTVKKILCSQRAGDF